MMKIKRIYDEPDASDGYRVLVDRLWPRGLSKEKARVDEWLKEAGPSDALRKWFHEGPERWEEFKACYKEELMKKKAIFDKLVLKSQKGRVTLLYSYHDPEHNQAVVIMEFLEGKRFSRKSEA